jgi:hypothetical protein
MIAKRINFFESIIIERLLGIIDAVLFITIEFALTYIFFVPIIINSFILISEKH